jgi:hypothetical protein
MLNKGNVPLGGAGGCQADFRVYEGEAIGPKRMKTTHQYFDFFLGFVPLSLRSFSK